MAKAKNVTVIPATRNLHTGIPKDSKLKRRVAGYARVSTDSDEQFTSYEAQVDYYTQFIKNNPEWEFVEVYTDEGISGVMTKNREGFNRMIRDALDGKIDLIVTKSVSRFARNTVDTLTTVRKLKDASVEVFFQKENIYTLDSKGELLITIMSSLAQEESRSISENVTWGHRKRFADGKVIMPYGAFLGYRRGPDGSPEIDPEEAKVVLRIYTDYMAGKSQAYIARTLTKEGIPAPRGGAVWHPKTIDSILRNEKYKGAALLQKKYTVDFLQKKTKVNEGEVPQYYVEESHPAIIVPEEWDKVQVELERRRDYPRIHSKNSAFSGMIYCGDCGARYSPITWHSTDKYRRIVWQCIDKFKGEVKCTTPHLTESTIQEKFLEMFSIYYSDRKAVLDTLRGVKKALTDTDFIDEDISDCENELDLFQEMLKQTVMQNASATVSEEEYKRHYNDLTERYQVAEEKLNTLLAERKRMEAEALAISGMLFELMELEQLPIEFDEKLWNATVKRLTVYEDERLVFSLKDGTEITILL
jgi:DNA invertase Pin-like site-specific DNA recombinase/uncharacterized tellurite resistance protein B-like protein